MQATAAPGERRQPSRAQYAARRRREITYGRWAPDCDAQRVRRHVQELRDGGMRLSDIAQQAADRGGHPVSVATIKALLNGRGRNTEPTRRLSRTVATALMSVELVDARAHRLQQLRRACGVLRERGWGTADLRTIMRPGIASASMQVVDRALLLAVERAVLATSVAPTAAARASAAERLLEAVFIAPLSIDERRLVAQALCGAQVGLPLEDVALLLGVSDRTVRRDVTAAAGACRPR